MQKLLLLIITIIIGLFISTTVLKGQNFSNKNSVETKTFNLGSFNAVKSSQAIEVEIVKSEEDKAVATSNYISELNIEVKDKTLYVKYKPDVSLQNADTKVIVYVKDLVKAEAENASNIKVKSVFNNVRQTFETRTAGKIFADSKSENVYINLRNTGGFSGKINAKNLFANISSASTSKLSGSADHAEINADSASNLDAKNMTTKTAKVYATATSTVILSVSEELTAEATSLAKIKYKTLSGIRFSAKRKSGGEIDSI
ncbi:GIN domain-containing protein [Chryseobacterium luquanense]|uniref:DUF2807 domain-containing protein n=1 Tax=Chryseobacterium luquanense TaxID=2983766 RepID=A0ABT3Y810_9FLAO|nr:DUF2807 domain-containing protein [Chryseobacterium luquanense]MCX8534196.1 DUF2807 domain-containing protein [Chryseobacterium luquanense]